MPRKRFKIESVSACGAPFTIGRRNTFDEAKRLAHLHHSCTGRWPRILDGKIPVRY